jgi:hypothetical protein
LAEWHKVITPFFPWRGILDDQGLQRQFGVCDL